MQNDNHKNEREKFPKSDILSWDFKNDNLDGLKKNLHLSVQHFIDFSTAAYNEKSSASDEQDDAYSEKSPDDVETSDEEKSKESSEATNKYSPKVPPYPCFFFKALDMQILSNIPNFQGVRIFIACKNGGKLIIVPITKVNPYEETYSQTYTTNGEEKTTSTVVTLASGLTPCPPPPDGSSKCP